MASRHSFPAMIDNHEASNCLKTKWNNLSLLLFQEILIRLLIYERASSMQLKTFRSNSS